MIRGLAKKVELGEVMRHRTLVYGFAALWIIFFHARLTIPKNGVWVLLRLVKSLGACGVELFLLLSAVGLHHSMSRDASLLRFYKKRLLRVLPPFLIVMTLYQLYAKYSPQEYLTVMTLVGYWMKRGEHIPWFVPFILTMYLVYPLLFHIRRKSGWALVVLFALSLIMAFVAEEGPFNLPPDVLRGITRIPVFLLGCWVAPFLEGKTRVSRTALASFAAFCLMVTLAYVVLKERVPYLSSYSCRATAYLAVSAGVMLLLWALGELLIRDGVVGSALYRLIGFYGGFSLECYLLYSRLEGIVSAQLGALSGGRSAQLVIFWIAFFLTTIMGFLLRRLCTRLTETFQAIELPKSL